jgi:hypothetical protein
MIMYNSTPEQERAIHLDIKAALLINQLKKGQINRGDIDIAIYKLEPTERQTFKDLLNKYRAVKR